MCAQLSKFRLYTMFRATFNPRDEVHFSARCFLAVPDRVRLSRLCRWWPRPCSRRIPAGLADFAFLPKICGVLTRPPRWYLLTITVASRGQSAVCCILPFRNVFTTGTRLLLHTVCCNNSAQVPCISHDYFQKQVSHRLYLSHNSSTKSRPRTFCTLARTSGMLMAALALWLERP